MLRVRNGQSLLCPQIPSWQPNLLPSTTCTTSRCLAHRQGLPRHHEPPIFFFEKKKQETLHFMMRNGELHFTLSEVPQSKINARSEAKRRKQSTLMLSPVIKVIVPPSINRPNNENNKIKSSPVSYFQIIPQNPLDNHNPHIL